MVTVFTLTPANAAQALRDNGLDALGLTAVRLAGNWGPATPGFDAASLTLAFNAGAAAPWRGILEYIAACTAFRGADGAPIAGAGAVLRLHPQAAARLQRLADGRYGVGGNPHGRVIPETMLIRGITATTSPTLLDAGDALPVAPAHTISFHDGRGLIVDPLAVAAMLDDLITALPALGNGAGVAGAGGVRTIAGLAAGILVQVATLHGRPFAAVAGGPGIERRDAAAAVIGGLGANGLATLGATDTLAGTGAAAPARLRLGWAARGRMAATALAVPALPAGVALPRQFLRALAVDLDWHLRGNRSDAAVGGVPADDRAMPDDLKPQVRDGVTIDYLADGPDCLAAAAQVMARLTGAAPGAIALAVSPTFEGVGTAAAPGPAAHWPAFPVPAGPAGGFAPGNANPVGVTVTWSGANDVVVSIPAGFAPAEAAVRVFAQRFVIIEAIGEAPSFLRGDGGAAIAATGVATDILVRNPFGLATGDPRPDPATLVYDLVITPRAGARRLWAAQTALIAAGPAAPPADAFAGPDPLAVLPADVRSVCPVPLFGLARTVVPPGGTPTTPAGLALALLSESQPRQGPRLPTMMRHETIVVTGIADPSVAAGLAWDAVLTGGRWARETRSAAPGDANPGGPAGPDTHAPGVRVTGGLAYDAARLAVRRVQPILPLPGPSTPGWIAFSGGDNMNPPAAAAGATPGSSAGVLLQSVAAVAETPELSLLPAGNPLDSQTPITFAQMLGALGNALGLGAPPAISIANEDRLANEVRREYFLARAGNRDALWSLTRAIAEADELIYIETAGLARTARPGGTPRPHEIDLVQRIADRMAANANLKIVVCVPRETDFAPAFAPFVRRAIAQRQEAIDLLRGVDATRVAAFHPRGFPGRWAQLRTTNVIVDDVFSLSGATHFRRRGLTFDGSAAVASLDRDIDAGYSRKIAAHRRGLMAAKLDIRPVDAAGLPTAEWLRLQRPASAFDLIFDLLVQGGLGRLAPLWLGPTDAGVIPQTDDVADPDGSDGAALLPLLASLLGESAG